MAMPILATKLFVPPPRRQAVRRPRLVERLQEGLSAGRKLTLVSAPAGFGKTTLLSEWIGASRDHEPRVRFAWLSLDDGDNDPVRFLAYLEAALAEPGVGSGGRGPQASVEATLTTLINDAAASERQIVLVLDDFQVIESAAIGDALGFLLDHLPPTLHLVVASRSDPRLPVARMRARGELTELRAADLRFTSDETATFLARGMGLALAPDDAAALGARSEGWIVGLQLAALSIREGEDVAGVIAGFSGSHRFVVDYLVEEVLQSQSADTRLFLLQTAILDRLSGPLCDAVTGGTGGTAMLEALDRASLFVVPLDDRREWYRYHQLFAEALRARLRSSGPDADGPGGDRAAGDPSLHGPDGEARLHVRASEWYERHGLPNESVRHALAASDFPRAARVIEAAIPSLRRSRQDATLAGWLAALPSDTVRQRPVLGVFSAWSALVAGDLAAVEPRLAAAERMLSAAADGAPADGTPADGTPADGTPAAAPEAGESGAHQPEAGESDAHQPDAGEELRTLPVTIALYRAALAQATGDLDGITRHAQRALELTAPDDHLGRGAATGMLGLAAWARGDLGSGVRAFRETRASLLRAGNLTDALSTTLVVADMLIPLGRLREAQTLFDEALRRALERAEPDGQPAADLHAGLSELNLERNELFRATEHLSAGEALGEHAFSPEHRYRWFVAMAGVMRAEGRLDDAVGMLRTAERLYRHGFFPDVRPTGGLIARIRIAQGRLTDAAAWVDEQALSSTDELTYLREFGHITLARLLIARADTESLDRATPLLERLLDATETGGRFGTGSEILILRALALHARGDTTLALVPLERALTRCEPEGYVRLFVDEGAPMLALLRAAAGAGIRPDYVRRLSRVLRQEGEAAPTVALADPLSERELQVLRMLATELTGPEIARELHVSLNTMRTHTKHIFAKLDVNTRVAAVRRGEALGLL